MDEKYTYNGQEYSRADLEAKYGDKVDDAISKFGFELVQTSDKSDSDKEQVYSYGGVDYTQSQLNDKYGDKVNQAIEKLGIKKKDSTEPVQAQEAATQEGPLLGLGGVSEQATVSPSVGVDEGKLLGKSSDPEGKQFWLSSQNPFLKSQETEKFVPYDITGDGVLSEPEITIDEEAEDYIPDEFGAYSTSYEETEKDKSLLAQSEVKKQAQKRALKHEIKVAQLSSVDVKDKLFDKDYTDSLLDTYAPKDIKTTTTGSYRSSAGFDYYDYTADEFVRDEEKVDEYQVALNAAKQQVVSEKLSNIMDSGDTAFQSAELNIDKAMNSWLETAKDLETKEGRKDLTFIEDLILDDEYIKKGADISTVHDILQPGYVGGAQGIFDSEIDKFVEENLEDLSIESDEEKKMMKVHLKEVYKSKKKLDKAAGEVAKELGYDADDVTKDFEKIQEKITGYESEIKSLYTPYEAKAKQVQKDMVLEFEKSQDRIFNRISQSEEYSKLQSELQGKVNSGEMTEAEANSALNQRINIMISESPEATQLQKKYQGVLSSYESQFEKETSRIFSNIQAEIEQAKDLSSKDEEYRKMVSEKVFEMHDAEKAEIESDWKNLYFGGGQARGLKTGLGTMASMMSGGSEMFFGETEFSKSLTSVNNQIKSDNPLIDPGEFSWIESPFDPDWWATRVAPSAPMTFSLMVPGLGVGAGTAALATRIGLTGLSRALISGAVSGTGMRAMESFTEASLQYYDLIERGESVGYASIESSKTYTDQMGAGVFNVAEMTFIFLPVASRLAAVAKVAAQVPLNSFEELYQEEIIAEEVARKRYLEGGLTMEEIETGVTEYEKVFSGGKFSDMYNFAKTKQGQEVMAIGAIYGGAFGVTSFGVPGVIDGDWQRANSQRKLNNFLNEEIAKYSSTETFKNAEGKPLEFGMGGVVRGPAETMQEAKNRRIWQLKATLDEMQMKGLVSEEDTKLGKKQIDFAFGVADQMPVNLPLVTRGQLLQKLTEIEELEQGLEGMTNETLIGSQKKKIAKLKKESEEIIGGTAKGYFINNVSVTLEQFVKIATNPKFAEDVVNGNVDIVIMNDQETQESFANAVKEYKTEPRVFDAATDEKYAVVNEEGGDRVLTKKGYEDYVVSKAEETAYADEAAPVEEIKTEPILREITSEEKKESVLPEQDNLGMSDKKFNLKNESSFGDKGSVGVYVNPANGSEDVFMVIPNRTDDSNYIGYKRVYENGKPTNKFSIKAEMSNAEKGDAKKSFQAVSEVLPEGHVLIETENISSDGLILWSNQIKNNYSPTGNVFEVGVNLEGKKVVLGGTRSTGSFSKGNFTEEESVKAEKELNKLIENIDGAKVVRKKISPPGTPNLYHFRLTLPELKIDDTQTTEQEGVGTEEQAEGQKITVEEEIQPVTDNPALKDVDSTAQAFKDAETSEVVDDIAEAFGFEVKQGVEEKIAKAYHKAKADDTNPELVKAVEQSLKEPARDSREEGATDPVLQEQVEDATEEIVEGIKLKVNQSKDDAKTKRRKRKALGAVSNILNFKSNILPDTKVKVHETDESYRAATGVEGPGVYDATNDTIHINLAHEEAGDETVYHEMIHPIIRSAVKNETEARILTQRMVEGIVRSSGGNKAIVDKLKGWLEQYESAERPEETIAEVAGIIASEFKNLSVSAKNIIKDYINRMARKFGGKNLFRAVSKDADVVKVLNRLSEAMQAGEAITAEDLRSGEFEIKTGVERDVEQGTLVEGAEGTIPEGIDDSKGSPIDLKLRMPKNLLDRGGINIDDIKRGSINDLSGANAFVFAADQATYGLVKSPTGIEHRFFGGYLFPYGNKFGWAFTGEEGANKIISKINESDGIGLVMSQAPDGIKGSLAFWEYMYAEIENAISKGVSEQKILEYVNSKLQLAKIPQTLKEKGIKTQIDRLDELKTLMPIEGKNKISYEVRGSFTKAFFSATSFDEFGIPPLNKTAKVDLGVLDYVNDPSLKSVGYGDIVSAIQFDKDAKPIRLDKNDPNYHPSYPVVISGKPIMVFNNAVDVRDVYPNAVPKSEKASQVPLGQRKKSAAARSAMGGQYIAEVPSGISEGQPIIKQRKASPEKFVSELEKTKASDPTQYWSVNYVSLSAAKKGKVISVDGGYGFVSNDGDIKGVFKLPTSKVKGVADNILQEAVNQGGTNLDNFDGYLTKIYERNGFRIAARIPFNEEIAPDGWNKAKHGTPDVVAMVYDPNNKLGIKEKKFDDYDAGIAYRDSFLEEKTPAPKKTGVKERKASSPDQKVRASIDFQNRYGKYFTISRDFNNDKHLSNYINFMERKGNKEIGTNTYPIDLKGRKGKPTENIKDKDGNPVKFRKPRSKSSLERAIDKNTQQAKDIKSTSLRTKLNNNRKNFIDFRGDIKDLTKNQKELQGVYERIITSLGSNGVAKLSFDKAYDKIYDGLGPKKRAALDKIIIARRIIAINENRGVNNVDAIDNLFKNVPEFFTEKGGDYVTSFQQTMAELSETISNSPLEKDMIIDEAEKLMSIMPVMYSGIEKSKQERIIKELNKAVEAALKAENITFSDEQGNKLGLNAAYELLDAKRDELGDDVYDQVNERADKYFEKFQEMLDQDLAEGIISQEQYNAMNGIEYSPRVFVQLIYGIDNEIINNTSEVDNVNGMLTSAFGMNKDAIRTLRDGVRNDDLGAVFFEMITNSEVTLGNYINSRERLRKMNDLNSYTLGQLVDLEQKFNDLKSKSKLTKEERIEFETLKETFDAFSIKRKKGYLPVNFYEEGVKKKFYIRGDLYSQWYNLRPDLSIKWKPLDKILNSPIGILKTFATGVLSPLFGITASAMDLTQLMIFSDAKGFSEIMPVRASQIAKDLVGVPFFQKGVIRSILQEDELFVEAVNEGIMMDFLYTQGNMNVVKSMLKTGIETALEKTDLGFGGYVKSKKALLKLAEATLILNKMAELAPRLVAYQRTRDFEYAKIDKMVKEDALSKQEEDQMRKNARVKAAAIARELMNFAEGGEVTKGFVDRYSTYFNPAMQGTVTAARQVKENPIRTTSRAAQTAAMFSGMVLGLGVMLPAMLKDDDDDKEINEIIKETRDNASPYIKEKYFLIPTGKKDEDGNYTSIRLKKHPQMVPFYELFEIGYDNYLNGGDATAVVSKENVFRMLHAFFDNALPMNISVVDKEGNWRGKSILAEPFQRNPMLGGGLELLTGYDIYRNKMIEPQTFNSKNADQAVKGLLNPHTEDFYKSFALEMQDATGASLSPAEYKHFVERMITNPRNNLYVAAGYALLNQASDLDISKKDKSFFEDTYSMVSKKLIYSSTSKKGISKTKDSEFIDDYRAIDNKTYLIRESAKLIAQEVTKEGGLMKIASDEERKGMLKEAFDKFKKNLEVVAETYPEMNMDPEVTANEYASYLLNKVVLEAMPVDELNMRKYQEILSEPYGQYKYQKQALLFAHEFTKNGVMINPTSEDFILILDQMDKIAKNSNSNFMANEFSIEYMYLYAQKTGTITTVPQLNKAMKKYRMK